MLVFIVPGDGSEVAEPDVNWLRELVLNGDSEFWNSGSGQGWLRDQDQKTELLLTFHEDHGFSLDYCDSRSTYFVSLGNGDFTHKIKVYIGGDPEFLPTARFVSRKEAWLAIEEFCRSGRMTTKIKWGKRSEQKWSTAWWDHQE